MQLSLRRTVVIPALIAAIVFSAVVLAAPSAQAYRGDVYVPPGGGVIKEVAADLVVTSTSQGYGRGGWYTDAVIRNQGDAHAGGFYVSNGGQYAYISGLNAGSSTLVRFHRGYQCEARGTVMADAFNQVYELNESNNSQYWYIIC